MHDPPDDTNTTSASTDNGLAIRGQWQAQDKLPESFGFRDDLTVESEIFHREALKIEGHEVVFLSEANVRETLAAMFSLTNQSDLPFFARTVGTLAAYVERHQATVTTAIKQLHQLPLVVRLPLQPFPNYGDVITGIPSTLSFTKEAMDKLNENGRQITPPRGTRSEAILLAFARDKHEDGEFLDNNIEAMLYGEVLDLLSNDEVSMTAKKGSEARGILEVVVREEEQLSDDTWETVGDRIDALVSGLATVMTFNPEKLACKPVEDAEQFVLEPKTCECSVERCRHWIVDFWDAGLWS